MTPEHGSLTDLQSIAVRKKQQFGIETESERRELFENPARFLTIKQFKTALRVVQLKTKEQTNHEIENKSTKLAQSRLMLLNVIPIDGARSYDNVRALLDGHFQKLVQLF